MISNSRDDSVGDREHLNCALQNQRRKFLTETQVPIVAVSDTALVDVVSNRLGHSSSICPRCDV
jgi:hypothetical protein